MGSIGTDSPALENLDVIIVGAGFSGLFALHRFRKLGLKAKIYEAGGDVGGVWYWNKYPGARVDSEWPFYQLSIPEAWKDFEFKQRFPDHNEIRSYFDHMAKVLDLRKDCVFNARVSSTEWSEASGRWSIRSEAGHRATGKYIFLCTGLLHRRHYPDFPGIADYGGVIHHSGFWPDDLDVEGKKIAVVGAGATGVQIVQELSKVAGSLSVLMRRPSYCLPLGNREITSHEQAAWKPFYPALFRAGRESAGGLPHTPPTGSIFDLTEDQLLEYYETLWKAGSFGFGGANYPQIFTDLKANRLAYDFWAMKTRARISDPRKRELMAPTDPPYPLLTKRCPLEMDYYEMLDQPHVDIVDLNEAPIETFTKTGIKFGDGSEKDFDFVILATGFESFTGSVANMGLKDKTGRDIKDIWAKEGISTYLGMAIRGFPNAFMSYSPQAPTALSNGPTILECQVDYVVDAIAKAEEEGVRRLEPTQEAQDAWCEMINEQSAKTLYPLTNSWWTGGNVPGKKPQMLTYCHGIREYEGQCRATLGGWKGYEVQH